jgi:heme A synthase
MMRTIKLLLLLCATTSAIFAGVAYKAEAANVFNDVCSERPNSTVCKDATSGGNPIFGNDGVLTKIVNLVTIIVGIVAVITIILAGIKFITSGSNPQEVTVAREMILYAIVAIAIAVLAQAIIRLFINRLLA